METFFPLFAQAVVVALEAAWLTMAVHGNFRHPALNEREVSRVLRMDMVAEEDAEAYAHVSGRRIDNPRLEKILFRALVAVEIAVSALLWLAGLGLLLAAFGVVGDAGARALASMAVLGFVALWASLLIGGEWFWYWIGMPTAQQVHFFLILWGTATLIFLAVAP